MLHPSAVLSAHVPWTTLLELLGCEVRSASLPAKTICPICSNGQLVIFPDSSRKGQWYWCSNCKKSGDMLDLARSVWGLSLKAAVAKLVECGMSFTAQSDLVSMYQNGPRMSRQRADNLWQLAESAPFYRSTDAISLMQKLKLRYEIPEARWNRTGGQIVGTLHKEQVEATLHPGSVKHKVGVRPTDPSERRLFKGLGWGAMLVVPWRSLPGRLVGFTFVGRDGGEKDIVNHRIARDAYSTEGGLVTHPDFLESPPPCLLMTDKLLIGVRMHLRHFQGSSRPLPLAIWQDTGIHRTRATWDLFDKTKLVFWEPVLTAAGLAQAIISEGWISQAGPTMAGRTPEQITRYAHENTPTLVWSRITRAARPWPLVLSIAVNEMSDEAAEELFLQLRTRGIKLPELIQRCRPRVRERLHRLFDYSSSFRSVFMDGHGVEEKRQCWYRSNGAKEELICDGILRIVKVVHHPKLKRTLYQGYVLYQGEALPFTELKDVVERDPFGWMQDLLIKQGKGVMRFSPSWGRRAVALALQLSPAELVTGMDSVGWDQNTTSLVLPQFSVSGQGQVVVHDKELFFADAPGQPLPAPRPLALADLQALVGDDRNLRLVWAIVLHLLATILGPACRQRRPGLALVGAAARCVTEQLAGVLGVPVMDVHGKDDLEDVKRATDLNNWPLVVSGTIPIRTALQSDWVLQEADRNTLMMADWPSAAMLLLNGGWHMLEADWPPHVPPRVWKCLPAMVTAYLHDVCQRKLQVAQAGDSFLEDVAADAADWLSRNNVDGNICREGLALIKQDTFDQQVQVFGNLLCRLIDQKKLAFELPGYEVEDFGIEDKAKHFQVPKAVFSFLYPPAVDTDRISVCLAKANLLAGEDQQHWMVDRTWWLAHLRKWRALTTGRLKIHG